VHYFKKQFGSLSIFKSDNLTKIIAGSAAYRRWVFLGLQTQRSRHFTEDKILVIESKDILLNYKNNKPVSVVFLDSASLIGRNSNFYFDFINSDFCKSVFVVGDLGDASRPFKFSSKTKLLFNQGDSFQNGPINGVKNEYSIGLHNFNNGIYHSWLYAVRDVLSSPHGVLKLFCY